MHENLTESYRLQDQILDEKKQNLRQHYLSQIDSGSFKCLFAITVGKDSKENLKQIIQKLGTEFFDYLIFVHHPKVILDEPIFDSCSIIYEPGVLYYFLKKYLTPEVAKKYDYIFWSVDDVDISDLNVHNLLYIMENNLLDVISPSLTLDSYASHEIMLQQKNSTGRLVDMIELFLLIFKAEKYCLFWDMIKSDYNYWGWGYVSMMKPYLNFKLGIVDTETVKHFRPIRSGETRPEAYADMHKFFQELSSYQKALHINYGVLE